MRAPLRLVATVLAVSTILHAAGLPSVMAPAGAATDFVLVGAGDIASCGNDNDARTAELIDTVVAADPSATVFTTGDSVYPDGTSNEFAGCYDPTWGRHRTRTRPAPGNHDYNTPGAAAYFAYFGSAAGDPARGYYSYDLGAWHIVVLNSNCPQIGGCGDNSPQVQWLRADLAANPAECTLAYWHHPRFSSSSQHGSVLAVAPLWDALYDHGADLVLNGHDHVYERFAPQNPAGQPDPNGIRQFTVGTGGRSRYQFGAPLPNSEVRGRPFGVLELTLHDGSYSWQFLSIAGETFSDAGSDSCASGTPEPAVPIPFPADADARVEQNSPGTNFGLSPSLVADLSPVVESYVRFTVTGLAGPPRRARLRLFVTNQSSNGPRVFLAGNSWTETGITWNNRPPALGPTLSDLGAVAAGEFVDFEVSAAVTGNGSFTFGLAGTSTDGTDFASRQAAQNRPVLLIDALPAVRTIAAAATTPSDKGYWLVDSAGQVSAFGDARADLGSLPDPPATPIAAMVGTQTGDGYWLVDAAGVVYPFGDAGFFGSMEGIPLNKPVVGMDAAPDGSGYWLVASDGGIFSFGVPFFGSTGALTLNEPVVGMAAAPDGSGYWLVASDGGIFSFRVPFLGSTGSMPPGESVVGMDVTTTGAGYWITTTAGEVFGFGDAEVFPAA